MVDVGDALGDTMLFLDNVTLDGALLSGFENAFDDVDAGRELWRYDGVNVEQAAFTVPGAGSGSMANLTPFAGDLYFGATDGIDGFELWRFDGVSAGQVTDLNAEPRTSANNYRDSGAGCWASRTSRSSVPG